jgi:hypothetical protein
LTARFTLLFSSTAGVADGAAVIVSVTVEREVTVEAGRVTVVVSVSVVTAFSSVEEEADEVAVGAAKNSVDEPAAEAEGREASTSAVEEAAAEVSDEAPDSETVDETGT